VPSARTPSSPAVMLYPERTQVGIIGAGPAGLLLAHLLGLRGIDSVVVELRSRAYCEARQRAGVLEQGSADLLRAAGGGDRLDAEGLEHGGIYLQFDGERHHLDFRELAGATVTVYAQTEVVKDLILARQAAGAPPEFEVTGTAISGIDTDQPVLSYTTADGTRHEVTCDAIAGCDGFHGISRPALHQASPFTETERAYPYAWLGILAGVEPSTDELIYSRHPNGFALHSLRTPQVSRLYLQVPPETDLAAWPDDRVWAELQTRLGLPGWDLKEGPVLEKSITPMRSYVSEPMRRGRLFLAGDAAHIVPPTGAKGLNLALADVAVLADALAGLLAGRPEAAEAYSRTCLERVWRATHFSWWMTTMLHPTPGADAMEARLQLSQLRYVTSSRAAAASLAENYTGYPPLVAGLPG
jgi:p-hydroxybenzoate 3-monooxygenase